MNSSDFWASSADPFDVHPHPITSFNKRSIDENDALSVNGFDSQQNEKFERYEVKAEIVDSGTESNTDSSEDDGSDLSEKIDSTRWLFYKGLAEIAERYNESLKYIFLQIF